MKTLLIYHRSPYWLTQRASLTSFDRVLRSAWNETHDADCLHELARLLFAQGELETAIPVLEELLACYPDDQVAKHNLDKARQILADRE